jgi:hypothetical protein
MKTNNPQLWDQLRTAYRPETPELDVAAIMDAVRREAAARPLRRAAPGLAGPIPAWACTAAAILAVFATGFVVGRSVTIADQHISAAWTQSVPPEEFAQSFLTFGDAADVAIDDSSL